MIRLRTQTLWDRKEDFYWAYKRRNIRLLVETLPETIENVCKGMKFTSDEIRKSTLYNKYLWTIHARNDNGEVSELNKKHMMREFKDTIKLIRDIMRNGILDPLEFWRPANKRTPFIHKGYQRLIIAHVLGIPELDIVIKHVGPMKAGKLIK